MKRVLLSGLMPGEKAAFEVYDVSGKMLLLRGAKVTAAGIEKLKFHEIPFIYTENGEIKPASLYDSGMMAQLQKLVWVYSESDGKSRCMLKEYNVEEIKIFAAYSSEPAAKMAFGHVFRYLAAKMLKSLKSSELKIWDFLDYRNKKTYLCWHAVNAACVSMIIGRRMGLKDKELEDLCVGSLMSDLKMKVYGFTGQERELGPAEKEEVKQHVFLSNEDARATYGIPAAASLVAGQHHERMDGSGYPKKLSGSSIGVLARIAAVADVYDALISSRPHRQAYFPDEAWDYIAANSGIIFDPEVVSAFCASVARYLPGDRVLLSDGREAIVVENTPSKLREPIIKIIEKTVESDIIPDAAIDLSEQKKVNVVKAVKSTRREE